MDIRLLQVLATKIDKQSKTDKRLQVLKVNSVNFFFQSEMEARLAHHSS